MSDELPLWGICLPCWRGQHGACPRPFCECFYGPCAPEPHREDDDEA